MSHRNPLDTKSIKVTVEYEFTISDEEIDEDLIYSLFKDNNESMEHIISLLSGSKPISNNYREIMDINIKDI